MDKTLQLLDEDTWRRAIAKYIDAELEESRRTRKRYPIAGRVVAEYRQDDTPKKCNCHLFNVAAGGLMIMAKEEMPIGVWVDLQIELEEDAFLSIGMVCHCTQTVGGYKVGVRLIFR